MKQLITLLITLSIFGCGKNQPSEQQTPLVLHFVEQEKGIESYPVRMIVTPDFMRMDEGNDTDDYLLLNRKESVVYSINHESQSYYQFNAGKSPSVLATRPKVIKSSNDTSDMPTFRDIKPIHTTYSTDEKSCYDVISIPGLNQQAVDAMREYLSIMSRQHAKSLGHTPVELQQKCMLVNFIFEPTQHLEKGFPLRERDFRGYSRSLIDFETKSVDQQLFTVPENYEHVTIETE